MEYLTPKKIQEQMATSPSEWIAMALRKFNSLSLYSSAIRNLAEKASGQTGKAKIELMNNSRTSLASPLSKYAGAYFANEDVVGGSRVTEAVYSVNKEYEEANLPVTNGKIKLGPGIGYVQAPSLYSDLLKMGMNSAELTVNYNAPNGESLTRKGIARLMNAKTSGDKPYSEFDCFLTSGATEGIDVAITTFNLIKPNKKITILGPSYYAASYSAGLRNIKIDRLVRSNSKSLLLPSIEEIESGLSQSTGMLVLTIPNNPNGEIYSESELRQLLNITKQRNIIILFDDIFGRMVYEPQKNIVEIAQETGTLNNLVVIDSLSKSQNLPGIRPGALATKNEQMKQAIANYLIAEKCNPPLVYGPLLAFEGLAREIENKIGKKPSLGSVNAVVDSINFQELPFSKQWFARRFQDWQNWNNLSMRFYKENLEILKSILVRTNALKIESPDKAAFNTLIGLNSPDLNTNSMDFLLKLMLCAGVYTQVGPCFGMSQSDWDKKYGIQTRITYASDRSDLIEGIIRLIAFTQAYQDYDLGNPRKFRQLQINYGNQI